VLGAPDYEKYFIWYLVSSMLHIINVFDEKKMFNV